MPRSTPASYDEILRNTVPEPGLAFRPSREEEALSLHRFGEATEHRPRPFTLAERRTLERVWDVLVAEGTLDLFEVELTIDGRQLILVGSVPGPATSVRIEDVAAMVEGVDSIQNELIIRSPRG